MSLTPAALQRLRDAVGDDDLVIADILQSFVDEMGPLVATLSAAAQTSDTPTLRRVAHTLKSSCRELGDDIGADLCAQLEKQMRDGRLENVTALSAQIILACRSLGAEVSDYIATIAPANASNQ